MHNLIGKLKMTAPGTVRSASQDSSGHAPVPRTKTPIKSALLRRGAVNAGLPKSVGSGAGAAKPLDNTGTQASAIDISPRIEPKDPDTRPRAITGTCFNECGVVGKFRVHTGTQMKPDEPGFNHNS